MTALLQRARAGLTLSEAPIVDVHGHIGTYAFSIPDVSPAGLVTVMDRIGIRSIICSHMRTMSAEMERANNEVLEAMQAFPGRILGYISLWPADKAALRAEVETRLAQGFTGIKLHRINAFPYTDPFYEDAHAIANERRLPVLCHTWGEEDSFREIAELSARAPEASYMMAHSGSSNEARYIELARTCDNVYLDLTMSLCPRGLVERLVTGAGPDKVVFGSDAYFLSQTQQIGKVLGAKISEEDKHKILGLNALRILDRIRR
jgi:predicted TIM-barrel fold metal-dependent hydrolase